MPAFPNSPVPAAVGMVHVRALPGTPVYGGNPLLILEKAIEEAQILKDAGFEGIILENMHDTPYLNREVGPEIIAQMAVIGREVKRVFGGPTGIQILAGANHAALAAAQAAGLDFIRAEGFVFGHVADEGLMNSDAGSLLRYRRKIGAEHIKIWTDLKKKHSAHTLTADVDLASTVRAAAFFRSDGLIITGSETGAAPNPLELKGLREASSLPLFIGSGTNPQNLPDLLPHCDGVIVGSWIKEDGHWENEISPQRAKHFTETIRQFSDSTNNPNEKET